MMHFARIAAAAIASLGAPRLAAAATTNEPPASTRARLGAVVNVLDFGVKGDGKTDDTAALRALTERVADNATIVFPPGIYVTGNNSAQALNAIRVVGRRNVRLVGHGATLRAPDSNPDNFFVIVVAQSDGVTVEGFTFDRRNSFEHPAKPRRAPYDAPACDPAREACGGREDGILVDRSSNVTIRDCDFSETYYGIYADRSSGLVVMNNRCVARLHFPYDRIAENKRLYPGALLNVKDATGSHASSYGRMVNNYCERVGNCVYNEDGDFWVIAANVSRDGVDSQIYVKGVGLSITGNVVVDPGKDGIKSLANNDTPEGRAVGGQKTTITGNSVFRPGKTKKDGGIAILATGHDYAIAGNYVELDTMANIPANGTAGIFLEGYGAAITGNTVVGPGSDGANRNVRGIGNYHYPAVYAGDQHSAVIASNVVRGCAFGIRLDGHATYVTRAFTITGNQVADASVAISAIGSPGHPTNLTGVNIIGNTVTSFRHDGVRLENASGGVVSGNVISGAGASDNAISLVSASNVDVLGNVLDGSRYGVTVDSASATVGTSGNVARSGVSQLYRFADAARRTDRDFTSSAKPTRPSAANLPVGYMHFDTSLGHPIWWSGSEWRNCDGSSP